MNNSRTKSPLYPVLNADIPVRYLGVSDSFLVKCAIRLSVKRVS
jgi:hypothetical protein